MKKILSQEEIDALLTNVSRRGTANLAVTGDLESRVVELYDFKHPERISKDQIRILRTIHDSLARMFSTYLSTILRSLVDVNLLSIDQVTFSEYSLSLSVPNALYIINSEKLGAKALLEISPQFILYIVDRLLGGMGDTEVEAREISQIELNVVERVVQTVINQLNDVWKQIHPLEAKIDGFESDPQIVQIARPSDTLAIIFFEIKIRNATFTMNLAFPYFMIEPIITKLSTQSMIALTGRQIREDDSQVIRSKLRTTNLEVKTVLAETTITVADFIDLGKDDLIRLDKRTDDPLHILVHNRMKFFGAPGRRGRHKAVKIIRKLTPDERSIYE